MPRFAANVSMLFTEAPFLERFQLAREAGFAAVEFLFPYDHDPADVAAAITAADRRGVAAPATDDEIPVFGPDPVAAT